MKSFDPFSPDALRLAGSKSWMRATVLQALCTCVLLGIYKYAEGKPSEAHARFIVVLGIVGTWSLALRTIRERLLELMKYWQKASKGLLRKASESGRHLIGVKLNPAQEVLIKKTIWRLRIIAAGLSIPFLVMPLVWSFISIALSFKLVGTAKNYWEGSALILVVSALIVAGYLHWALLPIPVPVRVSAGRRVFPQRQRRK